MAGVVHAAGENGRGTFAGLHTEELPAERGFAWIDAPLARIAPRGTGENADRGIMVDAVTWAVRTCARPDGALVPGVQVTSWADLRRPGPWTPPGGGRPARYALLPLLPLLTDVIPLGGTPPGARGGGTQGLAYWARVLWVYMSAEITAMSRDPVARAYRRRAAGGPAPGGGERGDAPPCPHRQRRLRRAPARRLVVLLARPGPPPARPPRPRRGPAPRDPRRARPGALRHLRRGRQLGARLRQGT
jgi:hypothetical protein